MKPNSFSIPSGLLKPAPWWLLVIILCVYGFATAVSVSAQQEEYHRLKFYLHSDLVASLTTEELNGRLTLYAEDLNTIFYQTNRRFLFDPATDIIITDTQPHTGSGSPPFPTTGYEVWIHAQLSSYMADGRPHTYGGSASYDGPSGAGVAAGLYWDAVHDRTIIADGSRDMEEYWLQIDHIVHELSHVFGAGMSEYYSLAQINDVTGVAPIQNVNSLAANDPYWTEHPDYIADTLLGNIWNRAAVGSPTGYAELMGTVNMAEVTTAVINAPCRVGNISCLQDTIPDLNNPTVQVLDAVTGNPISGAQVMVWNIRSVNPYTPVLLTDDLTDGAGEAPFVWDTVSPIAWFGNFNNMKLIKAFASNYQPAVTYVSIFDAQERKMVHGLDEMVVTLYMWPDTVFAAPDAATCASWTPCYSGSTSIQDALNALPDGGRVMILGSHTVATSLQSGSGGANRAAIDGRYGGIITWNGGAGNLFASGSGPLTVIGLTLQCQTGCTNSIFFNQSGGELLAYANNISGFDLGYSGSGNANLRHNWWGNGATAVSIGQNDAFEFRLGASVHTWETLTLGEAKMRNLNGEGIGILVSHGRGETQAPFGAATSADGNSQCSDYYDYFLVNGAGDWLVETPIDGSPAGCIDAHTNKQIVIFALNANGAPDTSCVGGACWQSVNQVVSLTRPYNLRLRLNASQLQGTPIVAANEAGNDPTAVSLINLYHTSDETSAGVFAIVVGLLLVSTGLWLRRY